VTPREPCEQWLESLSACADRECGPAEALRVWLHLLGCAGCRGWLRLVRQDRRRFKDAYLHSARGADITAGVMQEVHRMAQEQAVPRRPAVRFRLIEALVVSAMLAILAAILFPCFARAREKARQTSCLSNMKQLSLATFAFAQDHEGRLPGAVTWQDDIMPHVENKETFSCPVFKEGGYALNPLVAGKRLDDIPDQENTVLLYEVDETGQPVFPHNEGANYAFVDGHCKWLHKREAPKDLQSSGFIPPTRNYGLAERLKLAYEATIEVWVENVYQALLQAEAAVQKCGGFLLSSQLEAREQRAHASMIVKVPTEQIGACINALGALGFVAHREIAGEDLTQKYVSATREIGTRQQREQRLSGMVQSMDSDKQRVAAEQELGEVEKQTDALGGTVYDVDYRVTLATISATLMEREPDRKPVPPDVLRSLQAAAGSFWSVLLRLGSLAAWILVFSPLWATAVAAVYVVRRRARREQAGNG
jgi:prepilin-type processing-associated H-X9-DG protein